MFNYFYDSLDTLKQVKKPTKKEIWTMVLQIFVVVIIATVLFVFFDSMFYSLSNLVNKALIK